MLGAERAAIASVHSAERDWRDLHAVADARLEREERVEAATTETGARIGQLVELVASLGQFVEEAARRQENDAATARRRHRQVLAAAWAAVATSVAAGVAALVSAGGV